MYPLYLKSKTNHDDAGGIAIVILTYTFKDDEPGVTGLFTVSGSDVTERQLVQHKST